MYGVLVLLHVLGATIWTGGHIVLSVVVLPRVLSERSPEQLLAFETAYERIGIPALVVQVVTGFMLAYRWIPDAGEWFNMANPVAHGIVGKILLLLLTVGFAIDAKFRVLPNLSEDNLKSMVWHIVPVTIISILFVVVGVAFGAGWL